MSFKTAVKARANAIAVSAIAGAAALAMPARGRGTQRSRKSPEAVPIRRFGRIGPFNGVAEVERRRRQIEAGSLTRANGLITWEECYARFWHDLIPAGALPKESAVE